MRLHITLCAAAERPRLLETIRGLLVSLSRYRLLGLTRSAHRERSERRSGELLEACRRRDTAAAVRILEEHVGVIARETIGCLEQREGRLPPGGLRSGAAGCPTGKRRRAGERREPGAPNSFWNG